MNVVSVLTPCITSNCPVPLPDFSDLRVTWTDFVQALRDFTPPSLWSAQLQSPGVAGMESVGGLGQARQILMDTILLPAKVGDCWPEWSSKAVIKSSDIIMCSEGKHCEIFFLQAIQASGPYINTVTGLDL